MALARMALMKPTMKRKAVVRYCLLRSYTGTYDLSDAVPIMHMDMDEEADVASEEE